LKSIKEKEKLPEKKEKKQKKQKGGD